MVFTGYQFWMLYSQQKINVSPNILHCKCIIGFRVDSLKSVFQTVLLSNEKSPCTQVVFIGPMSLFSPSLSQRSLFLASQWCWATQCSTLTVFFNFGRHQFQITFVWDKRKCYYRKCWCLSTVFWRLWNIYELTKINAAHKNGQIEPSMQPCWNITWGPF